MKKKGKTIKQHLQDLPEPYNHMALENMDCFYTEIRESQADALCAAFVWDKNPGLEFWLGILDNLVYLEEENAGFFVTLKP
jgi:hypothetical protein